MRLQRLLLGGGTRTRTRTVASRVGLAPESSVQKVTKPSKCPRHRVIPREGTRILDVLQPLGRLPRQCTTALDD